MASCDDVSACCVCQEEKGLDQTRLTIPLLQQASCYENHDASFMLAAIYSKGVAVKADENKVRSYKAVTIPILDLTTTMIIAYTHLHMCPCRCTCTCVRSKRWCTLTHNRPCGTCCTGHWPDTACATCRWATSTRTVLMLCRQT